MARLWLAVDKRALAVTALCLVVWRLLGQIPISDVSNAFINVRLQSFGRAGFFAAIGANSIPLRSYSIVAIGIAPYVVALVTMNLLTVISENIRAMAADPAGRVRLARWTRGLALLFAVGQAYGYTVLFENTNPPAFGALDWSARLAMCLEFAGGTAIMILLADTLDDFGLGFGYGAVIFYALGSVGSEAHRLADYFVNTPSVDALSRPLAVWVALTVGATAAGVAVVLAVRRPAAHELHVFRSGVLRPPQFVSGLMFVPTLVASYYPGSTAVQWFRNNWSPYSADPKLAAAYLLIEALLMVLFALLVAAIDERIVPVPSRMRDHVVRLALIGGLFLAIVVVAAPIANDRLTRAAGTIIPLSGYDILLVVAVILFAVRAIEGHRPVIPFTASPSGLP